MGLIDLHTHSNASDGTLSPRELIFHAVECGISVLALTDHDTVSGLAEASIAVNEVNSNKGTESSQGSLSNDITSTLAFIPGIEFAAYYKNRDIHILGLNIDWNNKSLIMITDGAINDRNSRNKKLVELFQSNGIPMRMEDLYNERDKVAITRAHFARYLIDHGYVKNSAEAFAKYLDPGCKFYIARDKLKPKEAIEAIINSGGIPVLAHPLLYKLSPDELDNLLKELISYGLQGLEVYYSSNINNDTDYLRSLARKYALKMTGGSDFHGANKPDISLGTGRGNLCVPESILSDLF